MRRALAGIGGRATAHALPAPSAAVHAPGPPRPRASAVPPPRARARAAPALGAVAGRAGGPIPTPGVRAPALPAPPPARAVAPVPAPREARGVDLLAAIAVGDPVRPVTAARRAGRAAGAALATVRHERVPWAHLSRARLGAAWEAAQRAHGAAPGSLSLVGVYGPLPLAAVTGVALEPDGRIAVALAPLRSAAAPGDVALARSEPGGRLLRCDLPYPDDRRDRRRTR